MLGLRYPYTIQTNHANTLVFDVPCSLPFIFESPPYSETGYYNLEKQRAEHEKNRPRFELFHWVLPFRFMFMRSPGLRISQEMARWAYKAIMIYFWSSLRRASHPSGPFRCQTINYSYSIPFLQCIWVTRGLHAHDMHRSISSHWYVRLCGRPINSPRHYTRLASVRLSVCLSVFICVFRTGFQLKQQKNIEKPRMSFFRFQVKNP